MIQRSAGLFGLFILILQAPVSLAAKLETAAIRLSYEAETLDWTMGEVPIHVINNIVEGLYEVSADGNIVPGQATKLPKRIGPSRWEIRLRQNLKWSDGTEVLAKDYIFAWNRLRSKTLASSYGYLIQNLVSFKAVGKDTIQIVTKKNTQLDYAAFTHWTTFPLKASFVERFGDKWIKNPSLIPVNGPYKIKSGSLSTGFELVPNKHHRKPGSLKHVQFIVVTDDATALRLYERNRLHFMTDLAGIDRKAIVAHSDYRTLRAPVIVYLGVDVRHPLFSSAGSRKTLNEGFDRRALEKILDGTGTATKNLSPNETLPTALSDTLEKISNNAGEIEFAYHERGRNRLIAEFLQNEWKEKIGLRVTLKAHDIKTYWARLKENPFPIFLNSFGPPVWSSAYYYKLLESTNPMNLGRWSNHDYDSAIAQQNWRKASMIFQREQPIIPLYFRRFEYLVKPALTGVVINPMTSLFLKNAVFKPQ